MLATVELLSPENHLKFLSLETQLEGVEFETARYHQWSPRTLAVYSAARRSFCSWAALHGVHSVEQITAEVLRAYVDSLAADGRAHTTAENWAWHIRRLAIDAPSYGYAARTDSGLADWVPDAPGEQNTRQALTSAEVQAVLAAAEQRGPRMFALVQLALCGIQTREIAALTFGDVDFVGGRARLTIGARRVDIPRRASIALRAYLASKDKSNADEGGSSAAKDSLFGVRTPYGIQRLLRRALRGAKITRPGVCPGSFRATARAAARVQLQ